MFSNVEHGLRKSSARVRKKSYSNIISGIVKKHPDGFGFLICEDQNHPDVYLARNQMENILTDDEIEAEVFVRKGRFYGKVKKIIQRYRNQVLGPLVCISKTEGCIRDEEGEWGSDIIFDISSFPSLEEGIWVQVQIISYPGSKKGFKGQITGTLGKFPHALSDNMKMLRKYNIPCFFSKESLIESKNYSEKLKEKNFQNRRQLQALPFVTIDSKSAKDFDDSIYVQKKENGWVLFVSIADVSFFVKEGSPLDQEAYLRGNSTYFPNFVSPMLPENLSQNLCSLKPKEDRFAFTAEIYFDNTGKREKYTFYESVICSHARLTYGQAQQILDDQDQNIVSSAIETSLKNAEYLARILMKQRIENGSLNLEIPETEVRVDQRGEPTDIIQAKRLFAHQLIEELMLACNQSVAEFLSKKKIPSIYRVHDTPNKEDLHRLRLFFQSIGLDDNSDFPNMDLEPSLNLKENSFDQKKVHSKNLKSHKTLSDKKSFSIQKQISEWISKMQDHSKRFIMNNLILRAMPQACYSPHNKGHFGLSFSDYTHFTSPIRRYCDLMVHRILKKELGLFSVQSFSKKELESKALFLSQCEQRSVKSERHIENIKKARFMHQFLGQEFKGIISSTTNFGFFVTLKKYDVDGLVHLDHLGGGWLFDPVQLVLRAIASGYLFHQGDEVLVQVTSSDVERGQIDFNLIEHNGKPFQKQAGANRFQKKGKSQKRKKKSGIKKHFGKSKARKKKVNKNT